MLQDVLPLRRWERNEGLKLWNSPRVTIKEFCTSMRRCIPTFVLLLFTLAVCTTDFLYAHALEGVNDEQDFNISFAGVQHNNNKYMKSGITNNNNTLKVPGFNVSSAGIIFMLKKR